MTENGTLQLISLGVLLGCWLFGFGWLSRKFERQADLYGVRTVTKDAGDCDARCIVHAEGEQSNGICVRATRLFGATLYRIADLNGIPREAPSWRHGSIQSRCDLLERMCDDPAAVRRFDRKLIAIKIAMLLAAALGTGVAIWLYWPEISRALAR